jgi:hypothetical protein
MTLSTNDNFANREFSIEELETIAAGGFWGDIVSFIEGPYVHAALQLAGGLFGGRGTVYAAGVPHKQN